MGLIVARMKQVLFCFCNDLVLLNEIEMLHLTKCCVR